MIINSLVMFRTSGAWDEQEVERLRSTSLSNAKQIVVGRTRDQVIVDLAANSSHDLNAAVIKLADSPAVKEAIVLHMTK